MPFGSYSLLEISSTFFLRILSTFFGLNLIKLSFYQCTIIPSPFYECVGSVLQWLTIFFYLETFDQATWRKRWNDMRRDSLLTKELQGCFSKDAIKGKCTLAKFAHYKCVVGALVDAIKEGYDERSLLDC